MINGLYNFYIKDTSIKVKLSGDIEHNYILPSFIYKNQLNSNLSANVKYASKTKIRGALIFNINKDYKIKNKIEDKSSTLVKAAPFMMADILPVFPKNNLNNNLYGGTYLNIDHIKKSLSIGCYWYDIIDHHYQNNKLNGVLELNVKYEVKSNFDGKITSNIQEINDINVYAQEFNLDESPNITLKEKPVEKIIVKEILIFNLEIPHMETSKVFSYSNQIYTQENKTRNPITLSPDKRELYYTMMFNEEDQVKVITADKKQFILNIKPKILKILKY